MVFVLEKLSSLSRHLQEGLHEDYWGRKGILSEQSQLNPQGWVDVILTLPLHTLSGSNQP